MYTHYIMLSVATVKKITMTLTILNSSLCLSAYATRITLTISYSALRETLLRELRDPAISLT